MRPNVAITRDPLDSLALPPTTGMELDYRTRIIDDATSARSAIQYAIHVCLWGVGVAIGLRVAGVLTTTPLFLSLATVFGLAVGIFQFITGEAVHRVLAAIAFGPLVWLLSVAANTSLVSLLVLTALLCALHLANCMTYHYGRWMHANIYLPRDVRQRWLAVWKPTPWVEFLRMAAFPSASSPEESDEIVSSEQRERTRYATGFPVVLAAYLLATLIYMLCMPAPLAGLVAVGVFVVSLLAYGVSAAAAYEPSVTPQFVFRLVKDAYVSWFTYNAHHTTAPGVFQSPYGFVFSRFLRTVVTLFLIAIAILPVAAYFPLGLPVFGHEAFLAAAAAPMPWDDFHWKDFLSGRPPHTISSPWTITVELTQDQRRYLSRLPANERERAEEAFKASNRAALAREEGGNRLVSRPEAMLWVYVRGFFSFDPRIILASALALVGCLLAPPAILGAIWIAVGGRLLVHHFLTLEGSVDQPGRYHPTKRPFQWDAYVQRIRESQWVVQLPNRPTIRERDHLLLGVYQEQDYPVLLSPGVLDEHAHIMGDSGAGKSALGLAPLLDQIIQRGEDSLLIIDLKGDMALFESVRAAVNRLNASRGAHVSPLPFRWFTNRPDCSTYVFNPFLQEDMQRVTTHQKVEILLKSLGLEYGEGYGTSYYSSAHRYVLERLLEADVRFDSFRELNGYFRDLTNKAWNDANIRPRTRDDATHLYTTVNSLAQHDAINVTARHGLPTSVFDQRIDMGQVVRTPQVVYFYLQAALEEVAVQSVAKLALHSLLVAAVRRGPAAHRVYTVVDEFQQVVSEDLQIFLRQARSAKIPVILANQTISDLRTKAANLIPTVQGNTRFRQVFSSSDLLQQKMLIDASGEAMYELMSYTDITIPKMQEQIGPRLRPNDIIQASNDELGSIVHVTRSHGFSQFGGFPFPMRSMFHIPLDEYRRRQDAPWPSSMDHPGAFTPPIENTPAAAPGHVPAPTTPQAISPAVQREFSDLEKRIDDLEETIR